MEAGIDPTEHGMKPKDAIESSTRLATDLLSIQDETETVEVDKQGDWVLIDGDPLSEPGALRNVWTVFQSGRRVRQLGVIP